MKAVIQSGLHQKAFIYCTITMPIYYMDFGPMAGPENGFNFFVNDKVEEKIVFGNKVVEYLQMRYPFLQILEMRDTGEPNLYEIFTLDRLHNDAFLLDDNDAMLYFHTKGIANAYMPQVWNWGEALNYYLIENHEKALESLCNDIQLVGLRDYMTDTIGCVSGNTWWTKPSYVKTLKSPYDFFESVGRSRMVESWISTGHPNVHYLYDIGDIHHKYFFVEDNQI